MMAIAVFAIAACGRDAPPPPSQRTTAPPAVVPGAAAEQTVESRPGFDSVATRQLTGGACYVGNRYVVVARDHEVGSDLYVRPRATTDSAAQCLADSVSGDMVFRTGDVVAHHPDAQHFLGLKGDLLMAWDGTGGASDLYVYDLRKRLKVLEVDGVDESNLEWPDATTLMVWVTKAYGQAAAAGGCPDTMPANPAQLDSLMRLQLPGLEIRPTGRFRCSVGQ